ncbi:MAG: Similarity with glutathionylspermidine synthase, group 1, partial [uncultured Gemmatimonadetes bacterium]
GRGRAPPPHGRRSAVLERGGALRLLDGRGAAHRRGHARAARALPGGRGGGDRGEALRGAGDPAARGAADRGVVGGGRALAVRALRPVVRRARRAQDAGVQRGHAHLAGGGGGGAMVLAGGPLPRLGPVQPRPRSAGGDVGGGARLPVQRPRALCLHARRGGRGHGGVPARHGAAGGAGDGAAHRGGDRVGRAGAGVRGRGGTPHPLRLQAVPVGVDDARGIRPQPGARAGAGAVDGARVEDDPLQQGHPPHPLGAQPRPPQPPPRLPRRPALHAGGRVRGEAAPFARGGERAHRLPLARAGGDGGRLRRGGLRVPGVRAAPRVRRLAAGDRKLDRGPGPGGDGDPRVRRAHHGQPEPVRAASDRRKCV